MKALMIEKYKADPIIAELPTPEAEDFEVLVEIHAASLNPLDTKIRKGELKLLLDYKMPLTLGNDFAGKVIKLGNKATKYTGVQELRKSALSPNMWQSMKTLSLGNQ